MAHLITKDGFRVEFDDADLPLVQGRRWRTSKKRNVRYVITPTGKAGVSVDMHRLLMPNVSMIDHRDGNGLNNRRSNLRPCTNSQNQQNRKTVVGQVQYRGVTRSTRKTTIFAQIKLEGQAIYLGSFPDAISAAKAYDKAAVAYFGEFANPNFPITDKEASA